MTPGDHDDSEQRLRPYVPELLLSWPDHTAWQELEGTLVSADISGFTALSERLAGKGREGAEELNVLISDCFTGMIEDCASRGGDIVKFGGDALLVWFRGDHHARRAVSAALAMRATIRHERRTSDGRRVKLSISIGVNSGVHHAVRITGEVPDVLITGPGATATVQAESDADAGMVVVTPSTAAQLPASWLGSAHGCGVVVRRRLADTPDPGPPPLPQRHAATQLVSPAQQATILAGITNEHRQVAVSFLAFGGADEMIAGGGIAELADRLQRLSDAIAEETGRNGTFLLATDVAPDGGKFVLAAGAPVAVGDHEDRLLRTLRAVVDRDPGLHLHAGVHRGSLFAGDLGSARRRVYTTLGDSMNLAARLAGRAAPGEIVVSRVTMEWSSVEFAVEPLPPFHVKGKTHPIHAGLLGPYVGRRTNDFAPDGPLVGRQRELDLVLDTAVRAASGVSTGVALVGASGVGVTRLLGEVAARVDTTRLVVVRCSPLDGARGHSAIAAAVAQLLDVDADRLHEALPPLAELGRERFPRSVPLLPLVAPLFGVTLDETAESLLVPPALRPTRAAQLMVQIVTALVDRHTVLVVDDLDVADDATQTAIGLLCAAASDVPLCTVVGSRPERAPDCMRVVLDPLTPADTLVLVHELLGDAHVPADVARTIADRSGGVPMFVTELVASVIDGVGELPDTLDAAIEVRLDRLDPVDRNVLRTAAVLGTDVDLATLGHLLDAAVLRDQDRWDRLSEFLERAGPGVVRFRFDTHRRAAYDGLPFRTRRLLHRRVLEFLEADGDDATERLATLAHHAAAAGDDERAWRYATAAGGALAADGQYGAAADQYRLARRVRRAADGDSLHRLAEPMADVFEIVGDFPAADDALADAVAVAERPVERARLLRKRGDIAERSGDYVAARRLYRRAATALGSVSWMTALGEQARLDCARSGLALRQSQFDEAWRYANLALAQAERAEEWAIAARSALMVDNLITQMSWSGVTVSRPDVLGLHQRAGDLLGAARWLSNQAVDRYYEGHWDDAIEMYQEAADQCARFGHLASEATALNNIAEIHSDRGHHDDARSLFRTARRSWRAIGYAVGVALVQANLGRLATRVGAFDDAIPLLTDAIERFERLGMPSMTADARLRLVEHAVLAQRPVLAGWWPDDADLVDDPVVELYRDRLRAITRWLDGNHADARQLAASTAARAHDAGVPFEESLALRVLAAISGSDAYDHEIDALHRRLGIEVPPPVVPAVRGVTTT